MTNPATRRSPSAQTWRARTPKPTQPGASQPGTSQPWTTVQGLRVRAVGSPESVALLADEVAADEGRKRSRATVRTQGSRFVVPLPRRLLAVKPAVVSLPPCVNDAGDVAGSGASLATDVLGAGILLACFVLAAVML